MGTADIDGAEPRASPAGSFTRRVVLGLVVLAGSWAAAMVLRRRRIKTVDLTSPDPFGSAVVRE
jgi:hypothetical protein